MSLEAVRKQNYPQNNIEILVVDGGSTDDTREIANKYSCQIIDNPEVEPVNAKFIGYNNAKGKYIIFLDSDEIIINPKSISNKIHLLENNPQVKAVLSSGYVDPPDTNFVTTYINEFGDPFSFFMYRLSKLNSNLILDMKKRYKLYTENDNQIIFDLKLAKSLPIVELIAGASIVDVSFLRENFPELSQNKRMLPHIFYLMLDKTTLLAISKNDPLIHYSGQSVSQFLNKIRTRVKNNTHFSGNTGMGGFHARQNYDSSAWRLKKYLFIPYALTLVFVTRDALVMTYKRKDYRYLSHVPLTIFTALQIGYHFARKCLKLTPEMRSYGESSVIK